ncbi:MAG: FecR domain-containing protein [Candidatus Rokubacteria bacterium]|nr:FecR domain-containing protein [Candidatus Rokubacteria bacterium]
MTTLLGSGMTTLVAAVLVASLALGPASTGSGQQSRPPLASATATLSILAGAVQHVPAGGKDARPAADGMNLAVGDRVLTGPGSTALVTFLDGSTLTVQPGADITVKRADLARGRSNIAIHVSAGAVWARVVRLIDPKSSFSLESNTYTATVHDGLIGAEQKPDGAFHCWTRAGALTLAASQGETLVVLKPGERATAQAGEKPSPRTFSVNQSVLRVTTTENLAPLVEMPDRARVAGFLAPGLEVNQVFGSFTRVIGRPRMVEVPAGVPGPFRLVIEGVKDGDFKVNVNGLFRGRTVYHQEFAGTIARGERFVTEITQELDGATPATAQLRRGSVGPLRPFAGPLPGKILVSPSELEAASGA